MSSGWIKLYRELLDKPIWKQSTLAQHSILIALLLMATHDDEEFYINGEKVILHPGQIYTSLDKIAQRAGQGISTKAVRCALEKFEKMGFTASQRANQGRVITIVNWRVYQGSQDDKGKAKGKEGARQGQSKGKARADGGAPFKNIKEYKNVKNDKNEEKDNNPPTPLPADWYDCFSPALSSKVDEWLAYKAEKRQSYKPQGLKAFIAKVERMAADYGDDAVASVISESMAANYQGIVWDWLNKKLPKHPQENFKSQERDLNYLIDNEEI